jgi:hypothetical protein
MRQPVPCRSPVLGRVRIAVCAVGLLVTAGPALAQTPAPGQTPPTDQTPAPVTLPREIDLNLINLPTTLSLRNHHSYFRLTHRFARDLLRGDVGEVASDLFGLDQGAVIGFEYRFALTGNLEAGVHRSLLSKTIQTFAKWDAVRQGDRLPVALSVTASVEGLNNLREKRQPALALTVSRVFGDRLALYATPAFVGRTHAVDIVAGHDPTHGVGGNSDEHADHADTWFAGFGARVRFTPTGYIVGEYVPRLHGYDPNANMWGVAIEKRTGGHTLQLNFTNSFATTLGQLARGGNSGQVLLGFNITRKF